MEVAFKIKGIKMKQSFSDRLDSEQGRPESTASTSLSMASIFTNGEMKN